jgi:hypothetical protein
VNNVLAGKASDIWAGAADPSLLNNGDTFTLSSQGPGEKLRALAAAQNNKVEVFGSNCSDVLNACHDLLLRIAWDNLCLHPNENEKRRAVRATNA